MATGPTYRVPFRRRRQGRTDFRLRLRLLRSRKPRVVVRRTNNNFVVQFVAFTETGDQVLAAAQATDLRGLGWTAHTGNSGAAYLTGLLAGVRAKEAGITEGVLDIGRNPPVPGSRVFAGLAGAVAAGIDIPHGETVIPSEERVNGSAKGDEAVALFEEVKSKITGGGAFE
ncbi:MAG: 50S ribosomal protein L18 [Euryarchaeota archaeon]|nr:50S ribosomal protein L18 [Euryarchaeota archaeon]